MHSELGAEVGDRSVELGGLATHPRLATRHVLVECMHGGVVGVVDGLELFEFEPSGSIDGRQELNGVVVLLPRRGIELYPEVASLGMPGPPEVVGEVDHPPQALGNGELGIGKRRDT